MTDISKYKLAIEELMVIYDDSECCGECSKCKFSYEAKYGFRRNDCLLEDLQWAACNVYDRMKKENLW